MFPIILKYFPKLGKVFSLRFPRLNTLISEYLRSDDNLLVYSITSDKE